MLDRATKVKKWSYRTYIVYGVAQRNLCLKIREKTQNCRRPTFIIHSPFSVEVQLVRRLSYLALLLGTFF